MCFTFSESGSQYAAALTVFTSASYDAQRLHSCMPIVVTSTSQHSPTNQLRR